MRLITTVALSCVLGACGGGDPAPEPVPFVSMQEDITPSFPAGFYVFRSADELSAAWNAAPQQFAPKPMPVVDFSRDTIVGVSLGVGIRCDVPTITDVSRRSGLVIVSYRSNQGTGVTTLACLQQWRLTHFGAIPATQDPITFQRVSDPP